MVVQGSPRPWLHPFPGEPVPALLERSARWTPHRTALIDADTGTGRTFLELWTAARRLARRLQDDGVRVGDRVAIFGPNSPEWAVAYYAVLLAGGVVTTLNPLYREREVTFQFEDAEPSACFAAGSTWSLAEDCWASRERLYPLEDVWQLADRASGDHGEVRVRPQQDLAVLPYSSGTTGAPKGVMLSHANLVANVRQFLGTGLADRYAVVIDFLPFFHIYGMTVLLNVGVAIGATQVVMRRFDPEQYLALIQQHRATNLFVVPPALLALAEADTAHEPDLSSVRYIISGAAPLPIDLARRVRERYGVDVLQGYGMTEASPVTHVSIPGRDRPGTIGPPVSDTVQRVLGADGRDLAPGEAGELLVAGPQVMKGYWGRADATAETLVDEIALDDPDGIPRTWLRTGDIVTTDDDGYVTVRDRAKEMIKYKGYQIAPAELEAVLIEHAAVVDAAVVPHRQPDGSDEIPKAYVVLRDPQASTPDLMAADLMAHVAERVAPYKRIRAVEVVDEIPRNASGKILRRELIQRDRAHSGQPS